MADKTVGDLDAGASLDGTELLHVVQGGNSRKVTAQAIADLGGVGGAIARPGGRLTLVTATPILVSDQTAKAAVYYTPYQGDVIPIFDGSEWVNETFTELTLNLDTSNHLLDTLYDVFVWNDAGTIKIGTGPAWNRNSTITVTIATPAVVSWTAHGLNEGDPVIFTTTGALPTGITAGTTYYVGKSPGANSFNIATSRANAAAGTFVATSGSQSGTHTCTSGVRSRGTGAGTTELEMKNGIWTNKNSITLKNGAGAGTSGIAVNTATYVGTIYCTANGQTGMAFQPSPASNGSNNILGVFNAYNRVRVTSDLNDSTTSWTYSGTAWRAANNSVTNRISWVDGLGQSAVSGAYTCVFGPPGATFAANVGVVINSTDGTPRSGACQDGSAYQAGIAKVTSPPKFGLAFLQAMERTNGGSKSFFGAVQTGGSNAPGMLLAVELEM